MAIKKRKANDLYVRGAELEFDDKNPDLSDEERIVRVWANKLNPNEHAQCIRRAQAAKASYLIEANDHGSDTWLATYAAIRGFPDREGLVQLITSQEIIRARNRIEAELAQDEEWSKDNYLQALTDAWLGDEANRGLRWTFAEEPNDPEAKRVHDEMQRFDELASLELKAERQAIIDQYEGVDDEEIWEKATDAMCLTQANEAFYKALQYQKVFYGIRDIDDHTKRHFATLDDVMGTDEAVVVKMMGTLELLEVDAFEGKSSPATPTGSDSSDQPETQEESSDSGLVVSAQ